MWNQTPLESLASMSWNHMESLDSQIHQFSYGYKPSNIAWLMALLTNHIRGLWNILECLHFLKREVLKCSELNGQVIFRLLLFAERGSMWSRKSWESIPLREWENSENSGQHFIKSQCPPEIKHDLPENSSVTFPSKPPFRFAVREFPS